MATGNVTEWMERLQMGFAVSYILVMLPLSVYILYVGFRRWQHQSTSPSSAAAVSHSDFFTYNLALMELVGVCGYVQVFFTDDKHTAYLLSTLPWYAETVFPVFTSVEQFLAVVYPITYLSLKRGRGLWLRNAGTMFVWLLAVVKLVLMVELHVWQKFLFMCDVLESVLCLIVMVFCSTSVLHVLHQPKPGDSSGVDRSKQRAFSLLLSISVILAIKFMFDLGILVRCSLLEQGSDELCFILPEAQNWVNLSTSLVMPLLFLQRMGKLC